MILKNIRAFIALICLTCLANYAIAQHDDPDGSVDLRLYYSDLYLALSHYEIDDVPFQQKQVVVRRNDSLLKLAKRNPIAKLDTFHLAAALYEANLDKFDNSELATLNVGAKIKMPSVGDIFYAQNRYEKLKVVGDNLDFTNDNNQMRIGLRQPLGVSPSMIGSLAGVEPLRHQEFSLPGYRRHTGDKGEAVSGFFSRASRQPEMAAALPEISKSGASQKVAGAEVSEKQNSDVKTTTAVQDAHIATAVGNDVYLGPPRNSSSTSLSEFPSDPLSSIIEWSYDGGASVGSVFNMLAEYVGYELASTDATVLNAYTRQLPTLQRSISGITAEDGFLMLAGRGLQTEFDHVARSVTHTPRRNSPSKPVANTIEISKIHEEFVQASGISSMLQQFPADIASAAKRHADRCASSVSTQQFDAARLYKEVVGSLQQKALEPVARSLVEWYESPTGRKVLQLEKQQIDDGEFQQFSIRDSRADRIKQIYDNTVTGKGIATIAVELDYAGWLLSGCKQKAGNSEDVQEMNQEMVYGQGIRKKLAKLELLLREDMLLTLAYQFSSLSERELIEYAEVITQHAGAFSALEQSIAGAIEQQTTGITLSSLD